MHGIFWNKVVCMLHLSLHENKKTRCKKHGNLSNQISEVKVKSKKTIWCLFLIDTNTSSKQNMKIKCINDVFSPNILCVFLRWDAILYLFTAALLEIKVYKIIVKSFFLIVCNKNVNFISKPQMFCKISYIPLHVWKCKCRFNNFCEG